MKNNMLINNLVLSFDHAADGQLFFRTESGDLISFKDYLLPDFDKSKKVYLSLDDQAIMAEVVDSKKILNDLLNSDETSK